jgi:hypothetical protein
MPPGEPPPASTETTPVAMMILRTRLLFKSAT